MKITPSNLKTKRRTLQDIPANVFDSLLAVSFREGLDTLYETLNGICETNYRNDVQVIISVAIVNAMVPIVHALLDYDGHLSSVQVFGSFQSLYVFSSLNLFRAWFKISSSPCNNSIKLYKI